MRFILERKVFHFVNASLRFWTVERSIQQIQQYNIRMTDRKETSRRIHNQIVYSNSQSIDPYNSQLSTTHSFEKYFNTFFINNQVGSSTTQNLKSKLSMKKRYSQIVKSIEAKPLATNQNTQEQFPNMQTILLEENSNIRKQNKFLVEQIKDLFQREIVYKQALSCNSLKIKNLQSINQQLQNQLHHLTHIFLEEMQIISSNLTAHDYFFQEEGTLTTSSSLPQNIGLKISVCFDESIKQLKYKINDLFQSNHSSKLDRLDQNTSSKFIQSHMKDKNNMGEQITSIIKTLTRKERKNYPCFFTSQQNVEQVTSCQLKPMFLKNQTQQSLVTLGRHKNKVQ